MEKRDRIVSACSCTSCAKSEEGTGIKRFVPKLVLATSRCLAHLFTSLYHKCFSHKYCCPVDFLSKSTGQFFNSCFRTMAIGKN